MNHSKKLVIALVFLTSIAGMATAQTINDDIADFTLDSQFNNTVTYDGSTYDGVATVDYTVNQTDVEKTSFEIVFTTTDSDGTEVSFFEEVYSLNGTNLTQGDTYTVKYNLTTADLTDREYSVLEASGGTYRTSYQVLEYTDVPSTYEGDFSDKSHHLTVKEDGGLFYRAFQNVLNWFNQTIIDPIVSIFEGLLGGISDLIDQAVLFIADIINALGVFLTSIVNQIIVVLMIIVNAIISIVDTILVGIVNTAQFLTFFNIDLDYTSNNTTYDNFTNDNIGVNDVLSGNMTVEANKTQADVFDAPYSLDESQKTLLTYKDTIRIATFNFNDVATGEPPIGNSSGIQAGTVNMSEELSVNESETYGYTPEKIEEEYNRENTSYKFTGGYRSNQEIEDLSNGNLLLRYDMNQYEEHKDSDIGTELIQVNSIDDKSGFNRDMEWIEGVNSYFIGKYRSGGIRTLNSANQGFINNGTSSNPAEPQFTGEDSFTMLGTVVIYPSTEGGTVISTYSDGTSAYSGLYVSKVNDTAINFNADAYYPDGSGATVTSDTFVLGSQPVVKEVAYVYDAEDESVGVFYSTDSGYRGSSNLNIDSNSMSLTGNKWYTASYAQGIVFDEIMVIDRALGSEGLNDMFISNNYQWDGTGGDRGQLLTNPHVTDSFGDEESGKKQFNTVSLVEPYDNTEELLIEPINDGQVAESLECTIGDTNNTHIYCEKLESGDIVQKPFNYNGDKYNISIDYEADRLNVSAVETNYNPVSARTVGDIDVYYSTQGGDYSYDIEFDYPKAFDPLGLPIGTVTILNLVLVLIGFVYLLIPEPIRQALSAIFNFAGAMLETAVYALELAVWFFNWIFQVGIGTLRDILILIGAFIGLQYVSELADAYHGNQSYVTAINVIIDDVLQKVELIERMSYRAFHTVTQLGDVFFQLKQLLIEIYTTIKNHIPFIG